MSGAGEPVALDLGAVSAGGVAAADGVVTAGGAVLELGRGYGWGGRGWGWRGVGWRGGYGGWGGYGWGWPVGLGVGLAAASTYPYYGSGYGAGYYSGYPAYYGGCGW